MKYMFLNGSSKAKFTLHDFKPNLQIVELADRSGCYHVQIVGY